MSRTRELADDYRYIAECLRLLDEIMNLPDCHTCAKLGSCEYAPEWGRIMRINCPLWEKE